MARRRRKTVDVEALVKFYADCNFRGQEVFSDWRDASAVERLIAAGRLTFDRQWWPQGMSMPPSYAGIVVSDFIGPIAPEWRGTNVMIREVRP